MSSSETWDTCLSTNSGESPEGAGSTARVKGFTRKQESEKQKQESSKSNPVLANRADSSITQQFTAKQKQNISSLTSVGWNARHLILTFPLCHSCLKKLTQSEIQAEDFLKMNKKSKQHCAFFSKHLATLYEFLEAHGPQKVATGNRLQPLIFWVEKMLSDRLKNSTGL